MRSKVSKKQAMKELKFMTSKYGVLHLQEEGGKRHVKGRFL